MYSINLSRGSPKWHRKTSASESSPGKFPLVEVFPLENFYWEYFCWYTGIALIIGQYYIHVYVLLLFLLAVLHEYMYTYCASIRDGAIGNKILVVQYYGVHVHVSTVLKSNALATLRTFQ